MTFCRFALILCACVTTWLWLCAPARSQNFLSLSAGIPPPLTNLNVAITNAGPGATGVGQPGSLPPGTSPFNATATMGDLAQVNDGQPAQAILGLRIRGNIDYRVLMSQAFYTATNLQFHGANVSGTTDRGSFIKVFVGTPVPVGQQSNVQGSSVNPALSGNGLSLSQVAFGTINGSFGTLIISGQSPTIPKKDTGTANSGSAIANMISSATGAGMIPANPVTTSANTTGKTTGTTTSSTSTTPSASSMSSATTPSMNRVTASTTGSASTASTARGTSGVLASTGNNTASGIMNMIMNSNTNPGRAGITDTAIDVPVIFILPTGMELGPVVGPSPGTFNTQLQFAIFPAP